jgi:hypothetical protein
MQKGWSYLEMQGNGLREMYFLGPVILAIGILLALCTILWFAGVLHYHDGVVYFIFHRNSGESMVPDTTGIGLRLPTFGVVISLIAIALVSVGFILARLIRL